jgi:hypothetical protein
MHCQLKVKYSFKCNFKVRVSSFSVLMDILSSPFSLSGYLFGLRAFDRLILQFKNGNPRGICYETAKNMSKVPC